MFVLLGFGHSTDIQSILRRLESNDSLSRSEADALAARFGPKFAEVLSLSEAKKGLRFVFDEGLPADGTVLGALHTIARTAFDNASVADIYAWTQTSTAPGSNARLDKLLKTRSADDTSGTESEGSAGKTHNRSAGIYGRTEAEKKGLKPNAGPKAGPKPKAKRIGKHRGGGASERNGLAPHARTADIVWANRFLDDLFASGNVTVKTTEMLRSLLRLRNGFVRPAPSDSLMEQIGYDGPPLPNYLTRSHASKVLQTLGGVMVITRGLIDGSHSSRIGTNPVGVLFSFDSISTLRDLRQRIDHHKKTTNQRHSFALLRNFVEEFTGADGGGCSSGQGALKTVIETVARDDYERMVKRTVASSVAALEDKDVFGLASTVSEHLLSERLFFTGKRYESAVADHFEVRDIVHREHELLARVAADDRLPVSLSTDQHQGDLRYKNVTLRNTHADSSGSAVDSNIPYGGAMSTAVSEEARPVVDLDAVFALMNTTDDMPFIKFFDGTTSTYKVNRMALHRQVIDVPWVAGHIRETGMIQDPFILFALCPGGSRSQGGSGRGCGVFRVILYENRRIDLRRAFESSGSGAGTEVDGDGGQSVSNAFDIVKAVHGAAQTVNRTVVGPLNIKDGGEGAFKRIEKDGGEVFSDATTSLPFAPFDPFAIVNSPSSSTRVTRLETATRMWIDSTHRQPSVREIVRTMNEDDRFRAHVSAALLHTASLASSSTGTKNSCVAFFRRVDNIDSDANWVAVSQALESPNAVGAARDALTRLSEVFLASRAAVVERLAQLQDRVRRSRLLSSIKFKVQSSPLQFSVVPTITVADDEKGGFLVTTQNITDPLQVSVAVETAKRAIKVAALNASIRKKEGKGNKQDKQDKLEQGESGDADVKKKEGPGNSLLDEVLGDEGLTSSANGGPATLNPRGKPTAPPLAGDADDSVNTRRTYDTLDALKRADRGLFDASSKSSNYATTCQKNRQPVVLSREELEAIPDDTYDGEALAVGSTPTLAAKNRYICPQVWCPVSRVPMTLQQYEQAGKKCPATDSVGEQAVEFNHPYWRDGRAHYTSLLKPGKHPLGFCMPCCSLKPVKAEEKRRCNVVDPRSSLEDLRIASSSSSDPTSDHLSGSNRNDANDAHGSSTMEDEEEEGQDHLKYIKGLTTPLENGRFGLLPPSVMDVFNERKKGASTCGNRPDGAGHFTPNTNCFVRRGVPHHPQRFLQCMLDVLGFPAKVTPDDLAKHIASNTTPTFFITINDGLVCRMFMSDDMTMHQQFEMSTDGGQNPSGLVAFTEWITTDTEYHRAVPGTAEIAKRVKQASRHPKNMRHLLLEDPHVMREFGIYRALQRFRAYLRDPGIIKTHGLLLGMFNQPSEWLNPNGINIVVFESSFDTATLTYAVDGGLTTPAGQTGGGLDRIGAPAFAQQEVGGSATVACELPRKFRLSKPFAFVCAQGPYYEPIYRVRLKRRTYSGLIQEGWLRYDRHARVRGIIDTMLSACRAMEEDAGEAAAAVDGSATPSKRHSDPALATASATMPPTLSNIVRFLLSVLGRSSGRLKAQVIDYTFRLVGVVTWKDIFVPLPTMMDVKRRTRSMKVSSAQQEQDEEDGEGGGGGEEDGSSHADWSMLVGPDAPSQVLYLRDVLRMLKPSTRQKTVIDLFQRLAAATAHPGYVIEHTIGPVGTKKNKDRDARAPRELSALVLRSGVVVPLSASSGEDIARHPLLREQDERYLEELNIMVGWEKQDEPRKQYVRGLTVAERERAKEHRDVASLLQESTRAFNEFDFLRSAFNPFPIEYRRLRMRQLLEKDLGVRSPRLPALVDELLYGEDPLRRRSTLHHKYSKARHVALRNSPTRSDYIFGDIDVIRGVWYRHLAEIIITPFAMPDALRSMSTHITEYEAIGKAAKVALLTGRCAGRRGVTDLSSSSSSEFDSFDVNGAEAAPSGATSSKRPYTSEEGGLSKGVMALLEAITLTRGSADGNRRDSASGSSSSSSGALPSVSGSESFGTISSRKRYRRHVLQRMPVLVYDCDLWSTFAIVAKLTAIQPESVVPASAFRFIIHNALMRDVRRYMMDPKESDDVSYGLSTHPTFSAEFRPPHAIDVDRMASMMYRPDYVPGLYDLRVLSRFCRVSCIVIDADHLQRGMLWNERENTEARRATTKRVEGEARTAGSEDEADNKSMVALSAEHGTLPPVIMFVYSAFRGNVAEGKKHAPRPRFDIVLHRNVWTKEDAMLLFPDDPGYDQEVELSQGVVSAAGVEQTLKKKVTPKTTDRARQSK